MRAIKTLFILGWKLLHHFLEYRHATTYLKQSTKWEDQVFAFKCCKMIDIPLIQNQNVHSKVYFGQYLKWPSIKYVHKIMAKFDPLPLVLYQQYLNSQTSPPPSHLQTTPGEKWVMMDIGDWAWGQVWQHLNVLRDLSFLAITVRAPLARSKKSDWIVLNGFKT